MKALLAGFAILICSFAWSQNQGYDSLTIYFDFNKYALTSESIDKLDSFLTMKPEYWKTHKLEIHGHCDQVGTDSYNNNLSLKRAIAVKKYMQRNQVPVSLITTKGYGENIPVTEGKTASERHWNRRVEIIIVADNDEMSITQKIADATTVAGSIIMLRNINFYGARHQVLPSAYPILEELLDVMKNNNKLVIEIQGHICCHADNTDGLDSETGLYNLSEARATVIRDYLTGNGIDTARVSSRGFGHSMPLFPYPEQSEEERVLNRRVEIKIISK
jgi:outer membrane protein OmpA-like peptidoglycan-associated protein